MSLGEAVELGAGGLAPCSLQLVDHSYTLLRECDEPFPHVAVLKSEHRMYIHSEVGRVIYLLVHDTPFETTKSASASFWLY